LPESKPKPRIQSERDAGAAVGIPLVEYALAADMSAAAVPEGIQVVMKP